MPNDPHSAAQAAPRARSGPPEAALATGRNKVPEVTAYFWIIKVLATTVGETAADFLSTNLHLGLRGTTVVMSLVLVAALVLQFRSPGYRPGVYWVAVVLISVVGTLVTDNLTDGLGVSLTISTVAFGAALLAVFAVWYSRERTLSIHAVNTVRREAYYWAAVLFTFALGTAAGDLVAERFSVGYGWSILLFAGLIAATAAAWRFARADAVLTFWLAYILTRPLGASTGDFLAQARVDGGLGLGTTVTSGIFLGAIMAMVLYLTLSGRDQPREGHGDGAMEVVGG